MIKLEVGQTWSNGKTTRRITHVIHRGTPSEMVFFTMKLDNYLPVHERYSADFRTWIERTGATLQEPQ
jgi:hypothetical protein